MKKEIFSNATKKPKGPRKKDLAKWTRKHAGEKDPSVTVQAAFKFPLDEKHVVVQPPALPHCDATTVSAGQASLANILDSMGPLPLIPPLQKKPALKRLAVDIPVELHARMKVAATRRGTTIRDDVTAVLERAFGKKS